MHQIGSLICNHSTRQIDGQNDRSVLTVCAQFHSDYAIVHNVRRIQQLFHRLYTQPARTNTKKAANLYVHVDYFCVLVFNIASS